MEIVESETSNSHFNAIKKSEFLSFFYVSCRDGSSLKGTSLCYFFPKNLQFSKLPSRPKYDLQGSDVFGDPKPKGDIPESLIPEPNPTPKSRT